MARIELLILSKVLLDVVCEHAQLLILDIMDISRWVIDDDGGRQGERGIDRDQDSDEEALDNERAVQLQRDVRHAIVFKPSN